MKDEPWAEGTGVFAQKASGQRGGNTRESVTTEEPPRSSHCRENQAGVKCRGPSVRRTEH